MLKVSKGDLGVAVMGYNGEKSEKKFEIMKKVANFVIVLDYAVRKCSA